MTNYAKLFGGVFSRIEEYGTGASSTGALSTGSSPLYSRAVKMLDTFLEKKLDVKVLEEELINWIDSPVLDDLRKDHSIKTFRGKVEPSIFIVLCKCGHLELAKWVSEKYPDMVIHDCTEVFAREELRANDFPAHFWPMQSFFSACDFGHLEIAKWLAEIVPDPIIFHQRHLLSTVCSNGHPEMVKWFLEKFPLEKFPENKSEIEEAFRMACLNEHFEIAELLLEKYPEIDVHAENESVFVQLCTTSSLQRVKWFVEKYPETDDSRDGDGFRGACTEGNIDVVKWMIEKYGTTYGMGFIEDVLEETCDKGGWDVAKIIVEKWPVDRIRRIHNKYPF